MCVLYCLVLVVIQLCVLSSTFGCEVFFFFFFKQKTAYEMRISDWSSDVCSSDLDRGHYTVYLPAYDDARLLKELMRFPDMQWQVFSKHRSEERRVGKECVSTCRSRWSPYNYKKKKDKNM